jgi:hypothetical protein
MEALDFRRVLENAWISDKEWKEELIEDWLQGMESNHHRDINSIELDLPATPENNVIQFPLQSL